MYVNRNLYFRPMTKKAIAYYRVYTDRQGQSGLGLEAQRDAVSQYSQRQNLEVIHEFTEIESGKKNKRPQLIDALQQCKKHKATLIIAKLDRLSRNMAFIANLIESKVLFVAVVNPHLNPQENPFILHILAAVAEHERKQINTRTKDALQAAKRRGVKLGKHGTEILSKENKSNADLFARQMQPTIDKIKSEGFTTVRAITAALNKNKVPTFRNEGQQWHIPTVQRLLKRTENKKQNKENSN